MTSPALVFDRTLLRRRRQRAALRPDAVTFLREEVVDRLVDRLEDIRRRLPTVLDLGCGDGTLGRRLPDHLGVERLVSMDMAPAAVGAAGGLRVAGEEELLPFAGNGLDAVLSAMALHWVNDLPGALAQIRWCLKPDGLFLAAFPGGSTLWELREVLMRAELEVAACASPGVSPFVEVRDAAGLLQRAGLALPVADSDRVTLLYSEPWRLLQELRRMGEAAALTARGGPLSRSVLMRALELYRQEHADGQGRVPATFEILYLAGWKPHESQQQPLPRGSGAVSLASVLNRKG